MIIICLLSLWVGYMFGVHRQMKRGDKELESAHANAKFWKDIAERQAGVLRPPDLAPGDVK